MDDWAVQIWQLLQGTGLPPPPESVLMTELDELTAGANLLPRLIAAGEAAAAGPGARGARRRGTRQLDWLRQQRARGAWLTWGVPGCPGAVPWLGPRLAWWPQGMPAGRRIGLASSRLGRQLESRTGWFAALRTICARTDARRDRLLVATGTTAAQLVERCAALYGRRVLRMEIANDQRALARWWRELPATAAGGAGDSALRLLLSPPLVAAGSEPEMEMLSDVPARDRALVALSDYLVALHIRRGGHVDRLLRQRLADASWPMATVYVALGEPLVPADLAGELLQHGAVGWLACGGLPIDSPPPGLWPNAVQDPSGTLGGSTRPAPIVPWPWEEATYLTHCTRRQDGPWPDQSRDEFHDRLLLGGEGTDHSALAALARIVAQRRLVASARAIRGGTPVVCFTAAPLDELQRLRVFRPHRVRWDFEPYGLSIHRDWLVARGAQGVRYGDHADWRSMPAGERPLYQSRRSRGRRAAPLDWTVEQEWRHVGDLDLVDLPADEAVVFVPSEAEAQHLAAFSCWPIAVLPRSASGQLCRRRP
jgi:hypothetical protein